MSSTLALLLFVAKGRGFCTMYYNDKIVEETGSLDGVMPLPEGLL
jgi:hypothetical protein